MLQILFLFTLNVQDDATFKILVLNIGLNIRKL